MTRSCLIVGLTAMTAGMGGPTGAGAQGTPDRTWLEATRARAPSSPAPRSTAVSAGQPVANLPHARGRSFRTLDEYLAHLRAYAAPIDRPWYREVGPGLFRLETGNLRGFPPPKPVTREQLERRFGFRR